MDDASRPEILEIELAASRLAVRRVRWRSEDRLVDVVGRYGGAALALAVVHESARGGDDDAGRAPFVIAAGEAVARGVPTAARACVAARVPLSGQYADGHVGGRMGERVAALASALVVRGRTDVPDAVLLVGGTGEARIECVEGLGALAIPDRTARLRALHPGAALLVTGPAGDAGIPLASLANEIQPPSFVGRGGLGAVLAGHGLRAIVLVAAPAETSRPIAALRAGAPTASVLLDSPRLAARAAGGTFEAQRAGRGASALTPADPGERKGCRGCPTPCGFVFERGGAPAEFGGVTAALSARQGAIESLGVALGFADVAGPFALLARCDDLGLDAKEVGAALALLVEHVEEARVLRGDVPALLAVLDDVPARAGFGARIAEGAARLARELGVESASVRGQSARADGDLASLLGQCVSTRGADPMRTFAFLAADVPDRARLERLLAPWPLPAGAEDPGNPAGKGRLVAWTESFQAAVDAAGFCAFSAAALVADGVLDLDGLARWIAPDAVRATLGEDGRALLAAGASIAILQRGLALEFGAASDADRPVFAARDLDRSGMLDEYRRFRGIDAHGAPTNAARAAAGTRAVLDLHGERAALELDGEREWPVVSNTPARSMPEPARMPGRVVLHATGPLRTALGAPRTVELALPASLTEVLEAAARAHPEARDWLVRTGVPVPVVMRDRVRVGAADPVGDGDELELVVALSGG